MIMRSTRSRLSALRLRCQLLLQGAPGVRLCILRRPHLRRLHPRRLPLGPLRLPQRLLRLRPRHRLLRLRLRHRRLRLRPRRLLLRQCSLRLRPRRLPLGLWTSRGGDHGRVVKVQASEALVQGSIP
jgi:hypothetical protein